MMLKKNHYLVNGLKHYPILKEYNDQKKYPIDLTDMIKKNMLPRKENCVKI